MMDVKKAGQESSRNQENKKFIKEIKDDIIEMVRCAICYGAAIEPLCCTKCEFTFCKRCIQDWLRKNPTNICPYRCFNPTFVVPGKHFKTFSKTVNVKCSRCQQGFKYSYAENHLKNCRGFGAFQNQLIIVEEDEKEDDKEDEKEKEIINLRKSVAIFEKEKKDAVEEKNKILENIKKEKCFIELRQTISQFSFTINHKSIQGIHQR